MIICFNVEKRFPWFTGDIEESYIFRASKINLAMNTNKQ